MSFEGEVIGWVAIHRCHHAFSDRPGDPHSLYRQGSGFTGEVCETGPERAVLLQGNAQFLGSRVFALPGA
jgi:hypothetical protein